MPVEGGRREAQDGARWRRELPAPSRGLHKEGTLVSCLRSQIPAGVSESFPMRELEWDPIKQSVADAESDLDRCRRHGLGAEY